MQQLLSDAIDDFIALRRTNNSKGTVNNNRSVMKRFLTLTGNIYVGNVTERHVTRFFEDAARTRRQSTLRVDHNTLSVFFKWARGTRRMPRDSDPMIGRRPPRAVDRERERLHVSRFPALLDAASDPRDRMVLASMLYLLVRDSEARSIRVGDVDLDSGYVVVQIHKSGKEDRMPICAELDSELRRWLTHYAASIDGPLLSRHFLLPRRQSVAITGRDTSGRITGHEFTYLPEHPLSVCGRVVRPCLEAVGFATTTPNGDHLGEGSHSLRRSGARALFDQGVADGYDFSLRFVQSMLHHESISQTEKYIGITADRRTRDERLRGQPMYRIGAENVVSIGSIGRHGVQEDAHESL